MVKPVFKKINLTLKSNAKGWVMDNAGYSVEIPKYSDGWLHIINNFTPFTPLDA